MRINPCHGCPIREGCEQREEFRRRASGIGARSVTFRCAVLDKALRRGRRIMVSTPRLENGGSPYFPDLRTVHVAVPATITGSKDARFTCTIDPEHVWGTDGEIADGPDEQKYRFRRSMRAARIIRFLDEPDMRICDFGRVQRGGKCDRHPDDDFCCRTLEMGAEDAA